MGSGRNAWGAEELCEPRACEERCDALGWQSLQGCLGSGGELLVCLARARALVSDCSSGCEPGDRCQKHCRAKASRVFARCLAAGQDRVTCAERARLALRACLERNCAVGCTTDSECPAGTVCIEGSCRPCVCPDVFAPVCGVDGVTYSNACEARCAHVEVAHEGPCEEPSCQTDEDCPVGAICEGGTCERCLCIQVFAPVCGVDGRTYPNACVARCAHVEVAHEGPCEEPSCQTDEDCPVGAICEGGACERCVCPEVFAPVCGVDGRTYPNACVARCAHVAVAHEGPCEPRCRADEDCPLGAICEEGRCAPCACPRILAPVCGVDGRTYPSPCVARCARAEIAHEGPCELR
jgi:hypothetical protein